MSEKTRLLETQKKVDEVVDIMRDNVDNLIVRDEKLEIMQSRSEHIRDNAAKFKQNATQVKRKMWWQNRKMCIIVLLVFVVIIVVIIVWLAAIK